MHAIHQHLGERFTEPFIPTRGEVSDSHYSYMDAIVFFLKSYYTH